MVYQNQLKYNGIYLMMIKLNNGFTRRRAGKSYLFLTVKLIFPIQSCQQPSYMP
jgi:hypothetical protein